MQRASIGWRRLTVLGAVVVFVAAACGNTGGGGNEKEVSVVGSWGGSEQESFLAMVKPWEDKTGNKVKYTGSRGLNAVPDDRRRIRHAPRPGRPARPGPDDASSPRAAP